MGEMIHGFSWNFISQAYKVFFSSLVLIILARLISVEEFGIIGMSAVFVLFFNTLLNIGFESSIVYSKSFKDNHLLSLLLVNILLGFIICGIGFLIAPLLSDFYNNDEIQIMVELQKIDHDIKYREEIELGYDDIRYNLKAGAAENLADLADEMLK